MREWITTLTYEVVDDDKVCDLLKELCFKWFKDEITSGTLTKLDIAKSFHLYENGEITNIGLFDDVYNTL